MDLWQVSSTGMSSSPYQVGSAFVLVRVYFTKLPIGFFSGFGHVSRYRMAGEHADQYVPVFTERERCNVVLFSKLSIYSGEIWEIQ